MCLFNSLQFSVCSLRRLFLTDNNRQRIANFYPCRILLCLFLFLLPFVNLKAEGSKELSANVGYRAYLFSSSVGNQSFPFPTLGTMKVYAKAGETICVGSSTQG